MKRMLKILGSLRLTILLLAVTMALVLWGTFACLDASVYEVKQRFFESFVVVVPVGGIRVPVLPGGYVIGALLGLNLLAAGLVRGRRSVGLLLIHLGLIVLIAGLMLSAAMTVDGQVVLNEGGRRNYAVNPRTCEIAVTRDVSATAEEVTVIPAAVFERRRHLATAALPFRIEVHRVYPRSQVAQLDVLGPAARSPATRGAGRKLAVRAVPPEHPEHQSMAPSVLLELWRGERSLGTWLLSAAPVLGRAGVLPYPVQTVLVDGDVFRLALRPQRYYLNFTLQLNDFQRETYPGSEIPRSFSSDVTIIDAAGDRREALIYMNHPLSHGGWTFYQAGFRNQDRTSVLQAVRNPGWPIPYIACVLTALGLVWHLGGRWLRRRSATTADPAAAAADSSRWPWLPAGIAALAAVIALLPTPGRQSAAFDLDALGRLPVQQGGRFKPLDTVARNALLRLHGRQRLKTADGRQSAMEWLAEVLFRPAAADRRAVFLIDNPEVLGFLGLQQDGRYYSFQQLQPRVAALESFVVGHTGKRRPPTDFGGALQQLHQRISLYRRLQAALDPGPQFDLAEFEHRLPAFQAALSATPPPAAGRAEPPRAVPPDLQLQGLALAAQFERNADAAYFRAIPSSGGWQAPGEALAAALAGRPLPSSLRQYDTLRRTYGIDAAAFNEGVAALARRLQREEQAYRRAAREYRFNQANPFRLAMIIYLVCFLLVLTSWLWKPEFFGPAARRLLLPALAVHTLGILWRAWLQGHVPVANLYSSAVAVGWGAVVLSLYIERRQRQGVGTAAAALIGFATLIIAGHLARSGDTMGMLRAVLRTNFWLTAHVLTIILGYSGAFLAGALGALGIIRRLCRRTAAAADRELGRLIFGVLGFALFFAYVGTVLGGIWADQAWGRFWGWDPKENGALLVILWLSIALHAKAAGLVRARGLMMLAVGGNIVTAFAWFGVNMLGVGLHSYGFMSGGLPWLLGFVLSQVLLLGMAAAVKFEEPPATSAPV